MFILTKLNQCIYVQDKKKSFFGINSIIIFVSNDPIKQVTKRKVVEIVIDQNLLWTDHVTHLIKQISKSVFQLSQISGRKISKSFLFWARSIALRLLFTHLGQMCSVYIKTPLFITKKTFGQTYPSSQNKAYQNLF